MKKLLAVFMMMGISLSVFAGPTCTDGEDKSNWIPEQQFQKQLKDQGYTWKKFKESSHGCYEIYGYNKEGQKVEIYFHPVTGEIVKQRDKS
ncbi:MAG: PepSY domain-containing protein [Psychromonas sp.]